jgi:hypothetical protein
LSFWHEGSLGLHVAAKPQDEQSGDAGSTLHADEGRGAVVPALAPPGRVDVDPGKWMAVYAQP